MDGIANSVEPDLTAPLGMRYVNYEFISFYLSSGTSLNFGTIALLKYMLPCVPF